MIEIKRWTDGRVLYTAKNAQDVRTAVEEAVSKRVPLNGAELSGAELNGAKLNGAKLNYAKLNGAELSGAELNGAKLNGAKLNYAKLNGAELNYAELNHAELNGAKLNYAITSPSHPLWSYRQDFWSILDQLPSEMPALREEMVAGRINGSTYNDGECGCLTGTIAIHQGCRIDQLASKTGIVPSARRPAEQWFVSIHKGDKPLPLDTEEWPSESIFRLSLALAWLDEWKESRTAIAATPGKASA